MKILHLALQAPYNEGWGYQENLLTKYQVRLGHEVILVTSLMKNAPNNDTVLCQPEDYMSQDGFRVIRLDYEHFKPKYLSERLRIYDIYGLLCEQKPDFIMVHGLGNVSALQVKKYVKRVNPQCTVIADNHLDYNIGSYLMSPGFSTGILRMILRTMNGSVQKIYSKVYGVTPWRCEFANKVFGIAKEKLAILPAGADDEMIDFENRDRIRAELRKRYNIEDDDFLIVTGGKIDKKKNIHLLMQAVSELNQENVKLIVFGNSSLDISETVEKLSKNPRIYHIGWIPSEETYNYFFAADLVFFPGQHSVMWEQAVACGVPCAFKHYHAMHHCDIGGNCRFLTEDSVDAIKALINEIMIPKVYKEMLSVAHSGESKRFLYSNLAKKSVEV